MIIQGILSSKRWPTTSAISPGESQSHTITVNPNQPPSSPVITFPAAGDSVCGEVDVTWTAASDPDQTEEELVYELQYSTDNTLDVGLAAHYPLDGEG